MKDTIDESAAINLLRNRNAEFRLLLERARNRQKSSRLLKLGFMPVKLLSSRCAGLVGEYRAKADLFCGGSMNVVLPEPVSTALYSYGYFDAAVCYMMLDYLTPGMTVFDVGCHFGFFSILASRLVGNTGQVHCFEPTPSTFTVAHSNLHKIENVRMNNIAASDVDGEAEFSDFGLRFSAFNTLGRVRSENIKGLERKIRVKTSKLGDYCQSRAVLPNFIKIDAENSEGRILAGLSRVLEGGHSMAIALEAGSPEAVNIFDILGPLGFKMQTYDEYGKAHMPKDPRSSILMEKDVLFIR